ncbi:MAG: hypothetical protein HY951_15090 [Bacteroidia bacterium]|nr:hypothetical protein [Bacteroidia bacterium]
MNSPKKLNYEIRPFKFTERKMLLSCFQKICNYYRGDYQYIGFGGLAFTDFKLFHKELHINELISIEGGEFSIEKLQFNSPFSFIKIKKSFSTIALNDIPLNKKTIVWLDYDGTLDNYFFDDLTLLFGKLMAGSIYIITCNRELKFSETGSEYTKEQFKEIFGNKTPYDISNIDFSSENNYKTIRTLLLDQISKIIIERNKNENPLRFNQLFNILYEENKGAKMFSFGGVLMSENENITDLDLKDFDFISLNDEPYRLKIPNLTRKEIDLVNNYLFSNEQKLLSKKIVSETDIEKYKKTYKYLPNYYDIRL